MLLEWANTISSPLYHIQIGDLQTKMKNPSKQIEIYSQVTYTGGVISIP